MPVDPLMVERRAHAETQRQLGDSHRRCLVLHEETKRKPLDAKAVDALLLLAAENGRIDTADLDSWRRKLETAPSQAIVELVTTPAADPQPARLFESEADDQAYRREAWSRLQLDGPGQVL